MPLKKTRQGLGPLLDTWIEVDLVLFSHSVMVYFANFFWRILTVHWLWRLVTSGTERTENFSWFLMIWQMSRHVPRGQDGRVALVFSLGLSRFQSNERVIQTSCLVKHQPRNRPLHNYFSPKVQIQTHSTFFFKSGTKAVLKWFSVVCWQNPRLND